MEEIQARDRVWTECFSRVSAPLENPRDSVYDFRYKPARPGSALYSPGPWTRRYMLGLRWLSKLPFPGTFQSRVASPLSCVLCFSKTKALGARCPLCSCGQQSEPVPSCTCPDKPLRQSPYPRAHELLRGASPPAWPGLGLVSGEAAGHVSSISRAPTPGKQELPQPVVRRI